MNETDQLNWPKDNFENIGTAWEGDLWDLKHLGIQFNDHLE